MNSSYICVYISERGMQGQNHTISDREVVLAGCRFAGSQPSDRHQCGLPVVQLVWVELKFKRYIFFAFLSSQESEGVELHLKVLSV